MGTYIGGAIKVYVGNDYVVSNVNNNNNNNTAPQNTTLTSVIFNPSGKGVQGINDNNGTSQILPSVIFTPVGAQVSDNNSGVVVGISQPANGNTSLVPPVTSQVNVNEQQLYINRGLRVLNFLERKIDKWLNLLNKATDNGNPAGVVQNIYQTLIRKGVSVNPYQDIVKPNLTINANAEVQNFHEWVNFDKNSNNFSMSIDAQAKGEDVHEYIHINPQLFQYAGDVEKPDFRVHEYIQINKSTNQKEAYIEVETSKARFAENIQITQNGFQWSVNYTNKAVA